jgi:hypothetical protein
VETDPLGTTSSATSPRLIQWVWKSPGESSFAV